MLPPAVSIELGGLGGLGKLGELGGLGELSVALGVEGWGFVCLFGFGFVFLPGGILHI